MGWGTSSFLSLVSRYGTRAWQAQPKGILHTASRGRHRPAFHIVVSFSLEAEWLLQAGTVACSGAVMADSSLAG